MNSPRQDAPQVSGAGQFVATMAFFILVGPLAGLAGFGVILLAASCVNAVTGSGPGLVQSLANSAMILAIGLPFAYLYGFIPAAGAGLLLGLLRLVVIRVPWYLALLIGLCMGVAFTISNRHDTVFGWPGDYGRWSDHLLNIFPCVAATLICWAAVRNWFVPAPAVQEPRECGLKELSQ